MTEYKSLKQVLGEKHSEERSAARQKRGSETRLGVIHIEGKSAGQGSE